MKILIIGFGKMGNSHFLSFAKDKKKFEIYLLDKKFKKKIQYTKNNKVINKINRIPKYKKFDLVIISTCSDIRLNIMKQVIKYNQFKYLLLEKFLFSKIKEYEIASNIIKKNNLKVFVNVWGKIILSKFSKIINKNKIKKIEIDCRSENLLTNLIHYYDFIFALTKKKFTLNFHDDYKVVKSKRNRFTEINGTLSSSRQNKIQISTFKNIKHHKFKIITDKKTYTIKINYDGNCKYYIDNKLIYKKFFPFSFLTTKKYFFKDLYSQKLNYFNNFETTSKLSINILLMLKKLLNKKLMIT